MRLLLINLERSPDRLAIMARRLAEVGQPFSVLRATDGRMMPEAETDRVHTARRRWFSRYPLTRNEIACTLSHLRAMQRLLDGPDEMLAVLEDDVTLDPALPRVLHGIQASGFPFDLVALHRHPQRREFFVPCAALAPGWAIGRIGYTQLGTQGYVVSRRGAARVLAGCERLVHSFDIYLQRVWANGLDLYGLNRAAVLADPAFTSTIGGRAARDPLPEADRWHWRGAQRLTRAADSLAKRLHFPLYVQLGRRRLAVRRGSPVGSLAWPVPAEPEA